jgi:TatD DNase family protein
MTGDELPGPDPRPWLEGSGPVDTHCHLFLMEADPSEAAREARARGVEALVCAGVDRESSRRSRDLADSLAGVFATAGVHPHSAAAFGAEDGAEIEELLADPRVVAVGETGLDYYRLLSPAPDQQRVFRTHCALARETGKPLVVHTRDAWEDVLRILEEERAERVVLHCFSGDADVAREAAARGYLSSFAGNLTYPKNEHLRAAAAQIPADLLLTETDSPFLAPQALRGRDNSPQNVRAVVEALAAARAQDAAEVARTTAGNARKAFGLPS